MLPPTDFDRWSNDAARKEQTMENIPKKTVKPWKSFRLGAVKGLDARYHKVYNIEQDGEYLRVQSVREDGEIVIGCYKHQGWALGAITRAHRAS